MDSKILNLFSFLNNKEGAFSSEILQELTSLDEFKKFKNIPKEILDILICKYSFNSDNKEIVDYLKSIGGSDELFIDVKQWMDNMFRDLKKFKSDRFPESTFYGTSKENIILEEDLKHDYNHIDSINVFLVFKSLYKSYIHIPNFLDILDIFHEYLINYLHLKGSHSANKNITGMGLSLPFFNIY